MTRIPLKNRVIVKELAAVDRKVGSIVIPDANGTQLRKGEVIGVGKGQWLLNGERAKPDVRVGDTVVYRQIAALPLTPLEGGKDSLSVISDDDILYIEA